MAAGALSKAASRLGAMLAVAFVCQGCSPPAKVVLYEERQQMNRGVRDVRPPVPRAKPSFGAPEPAPAKRGGPDSRVTADANAEAPKSRSRSTSPGTEARVLQ